MKAAFGVLASVIVLTGCGHGQAAAGNVAGDPTSSTPSVRASASVVKSAAPAVTGALLIDRVRWTTTAKGRQLQVFPTQAGRTDDAPNADARAWAEILSDAPNANTPGMHDQFLCHWNFARIVEPDKPSWDLEPWRPVVGYPATVAALCNPGGSEG
jgi:hypothetical protein